MILDGKSYGTYKKVLRDEVFSFENFYFKFTRIQSDPYAPPSVVEAICDHEFSKEVVKNKKPSEDFIYRCLHSSLKKRSKKSGSGNSGYLGVPKPSTCVLKRSAVEFRGKKLILRFFVGLPAKGRRIDGKEAERILKIRIPRAISEVLSTNEESILEQVMLYNDQQHIREILKKKKAVAFIAEGSVLPRKDSLSEEPMKNAKPFKCQEFESLELPSGRIVRGLFIPQGLTVITGGAYHGKTTLLEAIQRGIYNHVKGDGREFVISRDCILIFAEDGRFVNSVDISTFIDNLPSGEDTRFFSSKDASGSTSMASSIVEAIEAGFETILIDEDTSATNLLYKDEVMEKLIRKDPIKPLCHQIRSMIEKTGVSVVLISGASSTYLSLADKILLVEEYEPKPLKVSFRSKTEKVEFKMPRERTFLGIRGLGKVRVKGFRILLEISKRRYEMDLSRNPRIVEEGQVKLIARGIERFGREKSKAKKLAEKFNEVLKEKGFEFFKKPVTPDLAEVDGKDFLWTLNRIPADFG
nr:ABC-ATPase domain-containing protein [Ferroglobus sp.]